MTIRQILSSRPKIGYSISRENRPSQCMLPKGQLRVVNQMINHSCKYTSHYLYVYVYAHKNVFLFHAGKDNS